MSEYPRVKPRGVAERLYALSLHLFSSEFRRAYGDEMVAFLHDRLRSESSRGGAMVVWLRAALNVLLHAPLERGESVRTAWRGWRARSLHRRRSRLHLPMGDRMLRTILQDARHALRGMVRTPVVTLVILATLTLGIGANAAIFSVVNAILLAPLPYGDPDRLVRIAHQEPYSTVSEPEFVDYQREAKTFERMSALSGGSVTLTGGDQEPERVSIAAVSDGFFEILGVRPELGRTFTPEEDRPRASLAVVLSHGFWQRRFGADTSLVGREIMINDRPALVVGVMPRRFAYPSSDVGMWLTLRLNHDTLWTRNNHYLQVVAKLAPGRGIETARAELNAMGRRFLQDFPEMYAGNKPLLVQMEHVSDVLLGQARPYLYALLGAVAFVLLIACVNVANLLLARGEVRKKELAIRTAMGASRLRLTRQTLTESVLFALVGGALGLAAAVGGVRLLVGMAPSDVPRIDDVRVDVPVLLFTFGVAIATGLLFGILPAIRNGRAPAAETLRDGGRTSTGGGRAFRRARRALVISEVALAVVTLTGAGLLLRSLWNLQHIELGMDTENVLTLRVTLPERQYVNERATGAFRTLLQQVRALPGVRHAGAVGDLPIADGHAGWSILIDGAPATSVAESPVAAPQQATPGYFAALGIPILRGRGFTDADDERAPLVVLVNETMAREQWPGKDAIDGTIAMLGTPAARARVIGVVRDVRSRGFLGRVHPTMYFPHAQSFRSAYYAPAIMNLVVKTSGDPMLTVPAIRRIVRELEPKAPIARLLTMEQVVSESVAARRFATELVAAFAVLAVVLAGIGIYGVISYGVSQRAFEMGLRMALGAQRAQVVRSVLGDAVRTALAGVAIGTLLGIAVSRLMRSMFVNVEPWDPLTLIAVLVALVSVAVLAAYLPARRASTVGPARALRGE